MKEPTGQPTWALVDTAASTFADNESSAGKGRTDSIKANFKKI
jgi:hypothetical protein